MPSKKPIIHFNTDQWIIDKMKYIAEENNRSLAKEVEYLCKQNIKKYEAEHGEIQIKETPKTKDSTGIKVIKAVTGISLGEALGDQYLKHKNKEPKEPE